MSEPKFKLDIKWGEMKFEPTKYTLHKVKPTGFFKWFKKPQGILESELAKMSGDYDELLSLSIYFEPHVTIIE